MTRCSDHSKLSLVRPQSIFFLVCPYEVIVSYQMAFITGMKTGLKIALKNPRRSVRFMLK